MESLELCLPRTRILPNLMLVGIAFTPSELATEQAIYIHAICHDRQCIAPSPYQQHRKLKGRITEYLTS